MLKEAWKPIKGYNKYYEISNAGIVRSVVVMVKTWTGKRTRNGRILSQNIDKCGRCSVLLSVKNKKKRFRIHRLVAHAFLKKSNNNNYVCHKDGNVSNNNVENLYWGNAKTNSLDAGRCD